MKLLHLIDSGGLYGAEKVLLSLASECIRAGHDVSIGAIVSPEDIEDALGMAARERGIRAFQVCMRDGVNPLGLYQIQKVVHDEAVELVHSHGYKANVLVAALSRDSERFASVATLHGSTLGARFGRQQIFEWLERNLLHRFNHVVAVSEKIAAQVSRRVDSERLVTIPNGIEVVEVESARRSLSDGRPFSTECTRMLAVGRLSREKGFDILLSATRVLLDAGVMLRLQIAGDGPEFASLDSQIDELGLRGIAECIGYRADIAALHNSADLFVLSSRAEGLPLVLLEAMALGTVVVANAVGEVPTVLEHGRCGWISKEVSVGSLGSAIAEAIGASRRDKEVRVQNAWDRVRSVYSNTAMANRYMDVYERAIAAKKGSGSRMRRG